MSAAEPAPTCKDEGLVALRQASTSDRGEAPTGGLRILGCLPVAFDVANLQITVLNGQHH